VKSNTSPIAQEKPEPSPNSDLPSSFQKQPRRLRRVVLWSCGLVVLLSALYVFRAPLLTAVARWWVVKSTLSKVDAIMVLGGGLPRRPTEAARLYHAGLAPKILYSDVETNQVALLGMMKPETTLTREVLIQQGVPESALECIGHGTSSTYQEALAARDWLQRTGARSLILTSDEFHMRRVCWVFRKVLRPTGVRVLVKPVVLRDYTTTNWWHREDGVVAFQNELVKYFYYRVKY
jgi:uncharacterized SAM-binding protein YcdF (DUF218 family)